jgi:hypothetical protein
MKWFLMITKMLGMIGLAASLYLLPFSFIAAATVFAVSSAVVVALKIWDMYRIGKVFSTTDRKRFPSILTIIVNVLFVGGSIAAMGVAIFSSYIPLAILPVIPLAALCALIVVNALLPVFTFLSAPDGLIKTPDDRKKLTGTLFGVNGFFKAMLSIFGLSAVGDPKDKFYNRVLIFAGVTAVSGTIGLVVGLGIMTLGATSAIGASMVLGVASPVGIGLAIGLGVGLIAGIAIAVAHAAYGSSKNLHGSKEVKNTAQAGKDIRDIPVSTTNQCLKIMSENSEFSIVGSQRSYHDHDPVDEDFVTSIAGSPAVKSDKSASDKSASDESDRHSSKERDPSGFVSGI